MNLHLLPESEAHCLSKSVEKIQWRFPSLFVLMVLGRGLEPLSLSAQDP